VRAAIASSLFLIGSAGMLFAGPCTGVEPQLAQVSAKITLGATASAEAMLSPIAASHPDCPEILLDQARISSAKSDLQAAVNLFVQYTDLLPDEARGLAYFGRFFLEQRDYQKADALSAAAVEKNPNDPAALALRGQILVMKGQSQDGKPLLEKAVRLDSNDPEAQFQLGQIYDREKNSIEAVKQFRKATALNPADARSWDYLALNLEPLDQVDSVEQAYRKGLAVNARGRFYDGFIDYNYGRFLAKRNQLVAAKEHLDRATESAPQFRAVWYERAKLNLQMRNYQQARTDAEKAASLEDRGHVIIDLQVYALLQQVYGRLGETALAKKYADLTRETAVPKREEQR
jgi:tetratricopeptide (TPR) repeat protein